MLDQLVRAVRVRRAKLTEAHGIGEEDARTVFFGTLLKAVSKLTSVEFTGFYADDTTVTYTDVSLLAQHVADEPTNLGWCYQAWCDGQRDAATWAVSRSGSQEPGEFEPAATQLYTDGYMAECLVERSLKNCKKSIAELSVLDPACGSGHFLVQTLRSVAHHFGSEDAAKLARERLFGAEIDPFATRLARACVLLEAARLGMDEHLDAIALRLEANITALPAPFGSLDNTSFLSGRKFTIVVTNPPYLGRRKLNGELRTFLDERYPAASHDLCAAFIVRCVELCESGGVVSLVSADKWLRLAGYRSLRTGGDGFDGLLKITTLDYLAELGNRAFDSAFDLHDGVGVLLMCVRRETPTKDAAFEYVDLTGLRSRKDKVSVISGKRSEDEESLEIRHISQDAFAELGPRAFLAGAKGWPAKLLTAARQVKDLATVVVGLQTNDDARFCAPQWLIKPDEAGWRVHHKGGGYTRWFGGNRILLNDGGSLERFALSERSVAGFEQWFGAEGWSYGWFANGCMGLRKKEAGWSIGRAASSGFFTDDLRLIAYLNSRLGALSIRRLGGKVQLPEGVVRNLPIPDDLTPIDPKLVDAAVSLRRFIVGADPREITFFPQAIPPWEEVIAAEALLLAIEALLERQVMVAAGFTEDESRGLDELLSRPVGAAPYSSDDRKWLIETLPTEFREMDAFLDGDSEGDHVECERKTASGSLPAIGAVEQISRDGGFHPIQVARAISENVGWATPYRARLAKDHVLTVALVGALQVSGHRWHSEKRPVDQRGVVTASEISRRASELLQDEANKFSELCDNSLERWITDEMMKFQSGIFGVSSCPLRMCEGGFVHVWNDRDTVSANRPVQSLPPDDTPVSSVVHSA